jgi:hypothetical protein
MKLLHALFATSVLGLLVAVAGGQTTQPAVPAAPPAVAPKAPQVDDHGWPDRRPVSGFTVSMPQYRKATNPHGWNEWYYGDLNPADPEYKAKFRVRFDAMFDQSLERAVRQDAQGILLKDVEGSLRDHANAYAGDPVHGLTDITREQIKGWADKAQARGLWLGFLIRDTINVNGMQAVAWDAAATFADKVNETKAAYGLKKMAVDYDSNVTPGVNPAGPVKADYMARVRKLVGPDVLIIGEFYAAGYETVPAVTAVMHDPRRPGLFDPPQDLDFGFLVPINTAAPDALYRAWIIRAMRRGAIPLLAATWDSPENDWMAQCRKAAGTSPRQPGAAPAPAN